MITKVMRPVEVEIEYVEISVPIHYGDELMPFDFPFRKNDMWKITVCIDTGCVLGWPPGREESLDLKVVDQGCYRLLDSSFQQVAAISEDYVPHGVVPGEYGDYVSLEISETGKITNWPSKPDVSEFLADN